VLNEIFRAQEVWCGVESLSFCLVLTRTLQQFVSPDLGSVFSWLHLLCLVYWMKPHLILTSPWHFFMEKPSFHLCGNIHVQVWLYLWGHVPTYIVKYYDNW